MELKLGYFRRAPAAFAAGVVLFVTGASGAELQPEQVEFFEANIRPILADSCLKCHSTATKQKGGLVLDSRQGWMAGGETGPALVPGDPAASLIMKAIGYEDPDLQMPPKKRLSQPEIKAMRAWIAMGAPDPREGTAPVPKVEDFDLDQRISEHWAWHPPERQEPPEVRDSSWAKTDIDRFILHRLDEAGLRPSEMADERALVRRLYFDLIGLPPTAEEVEVFVSNDSPDAYQELVDALLMSPHFGEKWGQHWLDLVRFADTRGHEADYPIPEANKYRNYVIRALNADVPYDQFLTEHIAGDLMKHPRVDPDQRTNESIQGTGFWHLGEATHSPVDIREDECARVANQIDVFSKAFLAMTVSCARCHDHKFDAISTKDYYALFGYLQSSSYHLADVSDPVAQQDAQTELQQLNAASRAKIITSLADEFGAGKEAFAKSLATAREALRTLVTEKKIKDDKGKESMATVFDDEAIGKLADERGLDRDRLQQTVRRLHALRDNPRHPLFLFAGFPQETSLQQFAGQVLETWQNLAEDAVQRNGALEVLRSDTKGELNYVKTKRAFDPAIDVIADYADLDRDYWLTSGRRFGGSTGKPGDLQISGDSGHPSIRMLAEPAAHSDLASDKFTGMLLTKTFEVTADRIWIRFRGKADLFMEVDSHRVCQGPLHSARLVKSLNGGGEFQWVPFDVQKYIGHRVHLEFTPKADFALSRVQFGDNEPVQEFKPDAALKVMLTEEGVLSFDGLATAFTDVVNDAFHRVAEDTEANSAAALVDQALQFRDLWSNTDSEAGALLAEFLDQKRAIEQMIPAPNLALSLLDGSAENEPVHIRGNYRTLGPERVPRSFLTALGGTKINAPSKQGSGRLQLARQVASAGNPLTARVISNRLWHYLFGRGIVATVDNFGATGQRPSHPELLDYLAIQFVENGWSMKTAIREIVLSSTYQQSSRPNAANDAADPTNRLLHRMPIRRLTGEAVRDSLLAVSGRLDRTQFGPSIMVHITPFMRNNRSPSGSGPLDGDGRRSIYIEGRRNHLEPLLIAFDKPTPFTAIGNRNVSNSPAQPLIMLNNPLVHEQARLWARRLLSEQPSNPQRIESAYLTAFARPPEQWESDAALEFLEEMAKQHGESEPGEDSWADLAHTLFNVKEFIFLN